MSVIIRLQNLPWSANALDVRTFFKGLSIPDGGVHIVGGEMGDAFIAFSTDEDARLAMMMSGGKIKEVQVSLLLSSRAEMQKVIEEARRTTMSFMQLSSQSVTAAPSPPAVAPVLPKVATVVPTTVAQQPQPPVISLSGFLAQNLNQQKVAAGATSLYSEIPGLGFLASSGGMFQPNAPAAGLFSALNSQTYGGGPAASSSANSAFTQLSEQLKKAAEAEKAAAAKSAAAVGGVVPSGTATKKDVGDGRSSSRWSRSSSRERDRRRSSRERSRSRSRDRGRRRSGRDRSRSRSRDRRSRSRSRDRRRSKRSRSRDRRDSRDKDRSRDRDLKDKSKQRVSRFSDRSEGNPLGSPPAVEARSGKVNPWETPIQQNLLKLASNAMAKTTSVPPVMRSPNASGFNAGPGEFSQPGYLTKPVVQQVNYGSFEASKPISNEHLSKLQELHSRRDPRTFQNPQQHQQSNSNGGYGSQDQPGYGYGNENIVNNISSRLNTNKPNNYNTTVDAGGPPNQQHYRQQSSVYDDEMEGQSVKISNLETATGYGEIRRFFSGQAISSNGIKMINDPNGKRTGVAYVRFLRKEAKRYAMSRNGQHMRRSAVKIESISDREFDDAIDSYQPGFDERKPYWVESYGGRNENKNARDEDAGVIEIPDESNDRENGKCGYLTLWNLPTGTTELDLMRIFSDFTIVEVLIIKNYKNPKQQDGYVKFCRLQDARRACESTHQHFIRSKRVFVKPCSDIEYDAAKNEYEAPEEVDEPQSEPTKEDHPLDDSVQVVEDSADSKKDEDDRMDLAEEEDEEEECPEEVVQSKIPLDTEEPPQIADDDPPLDDPTPVKGKTDEDEQCWEVEEHSKSQKQERPQQQQQQPAQQQQQLLPPQQSPQLAGPPPNFNTNSNSNNNFGGGDFIRDPRRRQEFNQRNDGGGYQQNEHSRESFDSRNSFNNGPPPPRFNGPPQQQGPPQNRYDQQMQDGNERTAFVLITNLEFTMREETVQAFLDREGFAFKKLQIIRNAFNRSSGECLVEFNSVQEAGESLIKNASVIGNRKAFFKQLVRGQLPEMMMRINGQQQRGPPGGYGGRYGGNRNFGGNFGGNGNFGSNFRGGNDRLNNSGNNGGGNYQNQTNNMPFSNEERQEQDHGVDDQQSAGGNGNFGNNFRGRNDHFNNNSNNGGGNFQNNRQSQPNNVSFSNDEPLEQHHDGEDQQTFDEQSDVQIVADENAPNANNEEQGENVVDDDDDDAVVINDGPEDNHDDQPPPEQVNSAASLGSQNGGANNSPQGTPEESRSNQNLNKPPVRGSILSLTNLPFRARNEELVDFFKQYSITIDDVKRRYLPDGRATGDAMVRFQSPQDAQQALETHQKKRIGGRLVRMWISD